MSSHLLAEFMLEDCDTAIRQKLIDAIDRHGTERTSVVRGYAFNRFNVRLDFDKREVVVDDELDVGEKGSFTLPLDDFTAALRSHRPTA